MAGGSLELDHVLIAAPDLEAAAVDLARLGLASVAGGQHAAWGTANRIVPLGETYLELIGIVDPALAATTPMGRWIAATGAGRPMGWVVRTDDIGSITRRLGLSPTAGARRTPDGRVLRWRSAGIEAAAANPTLPFFIEWRPETPHPGREAVAHPGGDVRLERIVLGGDADALSDWVGPADLPVSVEPGPPRVVSVVLATGDGPLTL